MKDKIRIAVQKKGRLLKPSLKFLKSLGFKFNKPKEKLVLTCKNAALELLLVRNCDIPEYVRWGSAEFGIVGQNVLYEKNLDLPVIKKLGFGKCSLVIAAPKGNEDLEGERIATSYPQSLKRYLKKKRIKASIIEIKGSVEIAPALNLSDAICDITQSGKTLKQNNLVIIDKILDSQAVLIKNLNSKTNAEILFG